MGILVDSQIAELLDTVVLNSNPSHVNPASLDICIGDSLIITSENTFNNYGVQTSRKITVSKNITYTSEENPIFIRPGERVLANSLEYFKFPIDIAGDFKLKSSVGRKFFQHMKAGWIDPGWYGTLTMEFINLGAELFPLYRGQRIGQIIFHKLDPAPLEPYQGKYNGQINAQPSL